MNISIYSIAGQIIKLPVIVKPKARKNEIVGIHDDRLKIGITASPVDGKANQALITFLSQLFSIPQKDVVIATGNTNNLKLLFLPITVQIRLDEIIVNIKTKKSKK